MSADGSRLAILVSVTLTCLGPGLCGAKAQAQDGHVIAVLLDDSGSMSYPIGQPEASDPDGSAGFAVTQLVRFLPVGTRLLLFTYASIDNEQNLRERGGVLYESPVLSDANRDRVSDEIAASILTRNRELMAAPTAGAVLHPYAFRHTPCSRAIAAVSSHLAASFQIPPPKGIEIIYLSDGVCIDGPPVGEESPVPASLLVGFPKDASGLPARFYFIRFRSKTASERLGVWSADGLEKEGTLTRLTNGATQEVNDKDPLAAFEVFGKIVDHIENRQATRIVPPLPALDYGQALGVNLLYTERCTTQNRCDSCERHRQVAEQRQMGGRFQTGRWGWPDAVRGTAGAFLRRQAPGAEPDRFCWVYARLLADDVQAFKPLLDEIEQPANRANRKAVIRADFKFQLELVPYEGNCGVMKGPSVQGGTAGVEEACVEGRILACTDTCEGATWSSLNLAFAKNATRSGMPPRLAGEIAVDGKSGTNNVDATASRDSPVWKLGVDLAECKDKTGAEHKKEVAFAARFGGRDIGDGLRQTLCRKCTDQDKDGICALDDCNDGDGSVNDRLSEKLAKDCIVPDRESGGPCGRSKWICNGKSYVCPPPPYDPKKPELCNRLDDNCDGRVDEGWSGDEPECPVTYWSWRVKEGAGSGAPEGDKSCTCSLDSDGNVVVDFGIVGSLGRTCTCPIAAELRQKVDGELTTAPDKVWFRLGLGEGYAKKLRNGANNCFEVKPDKPSWTITNGDNKIALTLVAVPENPGCGGLIESGKLSFRLDARLVPVETMPTSPEGKALTEYGVKLSGSFGAGIEASANPVFFHVLPDSTSSDDRTSPHILLTSASQSPVSVALGDLEINLLDDQGQAVAPFPARLEDFRESPWLWFESDAPAPRVAWYVCGDSNPIEGVVELEKPEPPGLTGQEGGAIWSRELCPRIENVAICTGGLLSFGCETTGGTRGVEKLRFTIRRLSVGEAADRRTVEGVKAAADLQFQVERTFMDWLKLWGIRLALTLLGLLLALLLLFKLFIAIQSRVCHRFRLHHRVGYSVVGEYTFTDAGAPNGFELTPAGGVATSGVINLREDQDGLPKAANYEDGFLRKMHAFWVRGRTGQALFSVGVTPVHGGSKIGANFRFGRRGSLQNAIDATAELPTMDQWRQADPASGSNVPLVEGLTPAGRRILELGKGMLNTTSWAEKNPVLPNDCSTYEAESFIWLPAFSATKEFQGYYLLRLRFQQTREPELTVTKMNDEHRRLYDRYGGDV